MSSPPNPFPLPPTQIKKLEAPLVAEGPKKRPCWILCLYNSQQFSAKFYKGATEGLLYSKYSFQEVYVFHHPPSPPSQIKELEALVLLRPQRRGLFYLLHNVTHIQQPNEGVFHSIHFAY